MADKLIITKQQEDEFRKRVENLQPKENKSFRKLIFDLYPAIDLAITEKNLTRQEVYEQVLDSDMKSKISVKTFLSYYHLAKKEWEERKKREARAELAAKRNASNNTDNTSSSSNPAPDQKSENLENSQDALSPQIDASAKNAGLDYVKKAQAAKSDNDTISVFNAEKEEV